MEEYKYEILEIHYGEGDYNSGEIFFVIETKDLEKVKKFAEKTSSYKQFLIMCKKAGINLLPTESPCNFFYFPNEVPNGWNREFYLKFYDDVGINMR